ncbi:MAG: hypothetical protein Q4C13_05725 [Clostridia bacterium]|nr:hypothetical protein [Clostridia bacterium]
MSAERLKEYLDAAGVIGCNASRSLCSLEDIGCTWSDAMRLIDRHQIFYAKAIRGRSVYFSPEAFYLLRAARRAPALDEAAQTLLSLIGGMPPAERSELARFAAMPKKRFDAAFARLLQSMQITALFSGRRINERWSTLIYGTTEAWAALNGEAFAADDPRAALRRLLGPSLSEAALEALLG